MKILFPRRTVFLLAVILGQSKFGCVRGCLPLIIERWKLITSRAKTAKLRMRSEYAKCGPIRQVAKAVQLH